MASLVPRAALLTLVLWAGVARAEPGLSSLFSGTGRYGGSFYELGVTWGLGGLLHAPGAATIGQTGVRFVQHQGFLSQLLLLALSQLGVGLGSVNVQIESEYETRYRDGREYKVETARTTTYSTTKSEAQLESELADARQAVQGLVSWFELTVYAPKVLGFSPGPSTASGYELSVGVSFQLGSLGSLPGVLSTGVSGANVSAPLSWVGQAGMATSLTYQNVGLLGRVHVPLTRFADVALEWQPNVYTLTTLDDDPAQSGVVAPSPLRAIAYVHLTNFVYVRGQVVLGGLGVTEGRLGFNLEVGGRL
ncbi:MAG: hypothetical protein GQE15_20535 [Archangiaceae bacterium]|nr:hypothetical protein [Archangiaceae bacterium]